MESVAHPEPGRLPRWLAGDWGRWIRDPVDLMRLALLVGVFSTLAMGPREQSFRMLLTFLITLIPRAIDAPRPFDFAFVTAMWLQAWGNVFGAFEHVYAYDKVVHTILSGAAAALGYLVLVRVEVVPDLAREPTGRHRLGMVLLTTALGWSLWGGLYEIYEWFANHHLGAHLHVGYGDSIGDLTVDGLGSLAGALLILLWDSRGWGTRRRRQLDGAGGAQEDPLAEAGEDLIERLPEPDYPQAVERPSGVREIRPGSWSGPLREPLDLLRLSFLVGVGVAVAYGNVAAAVRFALTLLVVLAVRRLRPPIPLELAFIGAMALQAWGGFAGELNTLNPYDGVSHFVVSAASAPILYVALLRLELIPRLARRRLHERAAIGLIGFAFGFSAGLVYEIWLYVAAHWLGASYQGDYGALISQLGLDAAGALIGAAVLVAWDIHGWALVGGPTDGEEKPIPSRA